MKRHLPLLFAALKFLLGFALASRLYELHRDEYLYLDYGRHLAWGYLEVPPLTALQSWLTLALGGGYFWVKFWPFLWGAATVYVVGRATLRLGGGGWAVTLASLCYLVTAFTRINALFQPNSFEILTFTLGGYWLLCYVQQPGAGYLYALGLTLGLSLLNKYTALFFIAALAGALLLSPQRRLLLRPATWGAAALALLLWAPNLAWQLAHGLPFRHHMQLLHDTQLVNVSAADFFKDLLLMFFPALLVWSAGLLALLLHAPFRPYRVVGLLAVLGVGLLAVLHGKNYYALGYFPLLFAAGAAWWQQQLALRPRLGPVLRPVLLGLVLLLAVPLFPYSYSVFAPARMEVIGRHYAGTGANRWEDGKDHPLPQDYADMLGWQELADQTWQVYQQLPDSTRARALILCDNYGQAGAINYYNRHRALPEAHSFNGSYLYWLPPRPARPYRYVIRVQEQERNNAARYARWQRRAAVRNPYARERGTVVMLGTAPTPAALDSLYQDHRAALAEWEQQQ